MELIVSELGQLSGPEQAVGIHQVRDIDLHILVFMSMYIKHKLDQGPVQSGQRALHDDKTRPGNPGSGLEIDQPQGLAQRCMVFRNKFHDA